METRVNNIEITYMLSKISPENINYIVSDIISLVKKYRLSAVDLKYNGESVKVKLWYAPKFNNIYMLDCLLYIKSKSIIKKLELVLTTIKVLRESTVEIYEYDPLGEEWIEMEDDIICIYNPCKLVEKREVKNGI